jgi:hypothetical protein
MYEQSFVETYSSDVVSNDVRLDNLGDDIRIPDLSKIVLEKAGGAVLVGVANIKYERERTDDSLLATFREEFRGLADFRVIQAPSCHLDRQRCLETVTIRDKFREQEKRKGVPYPLRGTRRKDLWRFARATKPSVRRTCTHRRDVLSEEALVLLPTMKRWSNFCRNKTRRESMLSGARKHYV